MIGIGIDVGGTFTKLVAVDRKGKVLGDAQVETRQKQGPRAFVDRVAEAVKALSRRIGAAPSGAGVGLAGDVDSARGLLRFAPNLSALEKFPFKQALELRLRIPVAVDNDANMAAWGAYVIGLKRRHENAVCITLGTGVGGGLILDGRLYQGTTGSAGEIGHTTVEPDGELCGCGQRGCLEAYAGTHGIVRTAAKLLAGPHGRKSLVRKLCPDFAALTPEILSVAAKRGDALAKQVWSVTGYYLGLGVSNAIYVLNPGAVVLTGGVTGAGRLLLDPITEVLAARPMKTPFKAAKVMLANTPQLGARGAALYGLERGQRRAR